MKRALKFNPFNADSIQNVMDELDGYIQGLSRVEREVPKKLCAIGAEVAQPRYDMASYAGANGDVSVGVVVNGRGSASIEANGEKVAFIEFGTGVTMGRGWPGIGGADLPWPAGVARLGQFGKKRGSHPPWGYFGEMGKHPPVGSWPLTDDGGNFIFNSRGEQLFLTHGNMPAAAMAAADAEMRNQYERVVKEVMDI